jgi:hypothetical protein
MFWRRLVEGAQMLCRALVAWLNEQHPAVLRNRQLPLSGVLIGQTELVRDVRGVRELSRVHLEDSRCVAKPLRRGEPRRDVVERRLAEVIRHSTGVPLAEPAIGRDHGVHALPVENARKRVHERYGARGAAVTGHAGHGDGVRPGIGNRRQQLDVQPVGEPEHRARPDLHWNRVRRKVRRIPRRPIAAHVTISAGHAQRVGHAEHQSEDRVRRKRLRQHLKVLRMLGKLGTGVTGQQHAR